VGTEPPYNPSKSDPSTNPIPSAQTENLQSILAGQIARALAVFCVDEVVVFDDGQSSTHYPQALHSSKHHNAPPDSGYSGFTNPNYYLAHVLSYLECPPYLRQRLFPIHPNLKMAGTLLSLDMPHHLRKAEWCQYREGVTLDNGGTSANGNSNTSKKQKKQDHPQKSTFVNAGFQTTVTIDGDIPPKTRVTLKFPTADRPPNYQDATLHAEAVAPSAPREEAGYYWGYSVRLASSLSAVITECNYDGGYDLTFGTSERGVPLSSLRNPTAQQPEDRWHVRPFRHMLIVFGGVAGLEAAVKADEELKKLGVAEPEKLFDHWVNLCPGQGSRTIRTEEAVWVGLMGLRDVVLERGTKG
jgi:predicted SPOUT superfamily RNA methylase MTH1